MAKERFYRTKPHVNVAAMSALKQLGLSAVGAQQAVLGYLISDPTDRALVGELLSEVVVRFGPATMFAARASHGQSVLAGRRPDSVNTKCFEHGSTNSERARATLRRF